MKMNTDWFDWSASFTLKREWLLFITFPTICFSLVIFFKQLRRKFPVQVNCWFCNRNTALPFNQRNSFTCPSCNQYNGFTEDGDYNKVIPEQQDELLNHIVSPRRLRSTGTTNGLCQICNNNQQLKIYQLANFVPLNEDNYDVEIEHFQTQLEKAYKLCSPCNYTVRSTIAKRNCTLLGKQIEEIRKSGKTLLNRSTTAKQTAITLRRYIMCSVPLVAGYAVYCSKREWIVLIEEYTLELAFAVAGSLSTMLFIRLTAPASTSPPLLTTSKFKSEKVDNYTPVKKSTTPQTSPRSYVTATSQNDAGDLSYASFNSPLNSTVRSDDGGSVCSELELITSNMTPGVNSDINDLHSDLRSDGLNSSHARNSFLLRKSPSSPSMYSQFAVAQSAFACKPPLNLTFQQLNLSAHTSQFPMHGETKRPILSPAKFRNPWTGKPWDAEVSSRSSSQSSGIYSRATSICGEEVTAATCEQNMFRNAANSLAAYTHRNSFSPVDNLGNMSVSRKYY